MARFFLYQNHVRPTGDFPNPEDVTIDKWLEPLSEPVRHKVAPHLAIALITSGLVYTTFIEPVPTPGPASKIVPNFVSTPVRFKHRVLYQAKTDPTGVSEVVTLDKWYVGFTDPVRQKPGLSARQQQFIALVKADPFPEDVSEDRWHQPWSEPRRSRFNNIRYIQNLALPTAIIEPSTFDKWNYPWSEPVRFKRTLRAGSQQFFTTDLDPIVSFSWFNELSKPVKLRHTFEPKWQQFWTFDVKPTVSFSWFRELEKPIKLKKFYDHRAQQPVYFNMQPPIIPSIGWNAWLSEPKRFKRGLTAERQEFLAWNVIYLPNVSGTIEWFANLSEPKRFRRALSPYLQRYWIGPERLLPTPDVTIIIDATETNNDDAEFDIVLYGRAVRANVSIKEIPRADSAYASIEET